MAGQLARLMCEGEDCNGAGRESIVLAKQAVVLSDNAVYTKDILVDFNEKGVEYLLVGGAVRGKRYKDIDVLYKNTNENVNKIIQILQKHYIQKNACLISFLKKHAINMYKELVNKYTLMPVSGMWI